MQTPPDGSEEIRQLFHGHIPEVTSGGVEIKGIARARGRRSIVCVSSTDSSVDPVGSCVGHRGILIKPLIQKLSGEMFDVVRWSDSVEELIRNLLASAKIERIVFDETTHRATIYATPDQLSQILNHPEPRLQMVSRLVGWELHLADS